VPEGQSDTDEFVGERVENHAENGLAGNGKADRGAHFLKAVYLLGERAPRDVLR
jgi:hypothetical protein